MRASRAALLMRSLVCSVVAAAVVAVPALAAIRTSQASLVGGQLTIVGSGAVPGAGVTVDGGPVFGRANREGDFTIQASGFVEPSCVATLFDGSVTVEVRLSGCTPSIPPPPAPPAAPVLALPPNGASVLEPATLSWQPVVRHGTPIYYRWELTTGARFLRPSLTGVTAPEVTHVTLSGLALGAYRWRVQAVRRLARPLQPLYGDWSAARTFTLTGLTPGTPGTPEIVAPAAGARYHPLESFPVSWTAATGAVRYLVQMANRPSFASSSILDDDVVPTTSVFGEPFDFITPLFIRVFGIGAGGALGLPSPVVALRIAYDAPIPPAPVLLAPPDGATVGLPLVTRWTPDPNPQIAGYQLELSRIRPLPRYCFNAPLCVFDITNPQVVFNDLRAGTYFWRVRSEHGLAGGSRLAQTAWSVTGRFTVSSATPALASLVIDVFTDGGTFLRSHTHVFSGGNEDNRAFGVVQLTGPAPRGGETVRLASSDPAAASVTGRIHFRRGHAVRSFVIVPHQVRAPTRLSLVVTLGTQTLRAPLTVDPADVRQINIDVGPPAPNVFSGGTPQLGSFLFNGNPRRGSVIQLASSSPAVRVPATFTVGRGNATTFLIRTRLVTVRTVVTITATWRGRTVPVRLTLQPAPTLTTPRSGATFVAGQTVSFRWHRLRGLSSELQIATSPTFRRPLFQENVDTLTALAVFDLPSGTLYWRVRGVDVYGVQGPPSVVRTLMIAAWNAGRRH